MHAWRVWYCCIYRALTAYSWSIARGPVRAALQCVVCSAIGYSVLYGSTSVHIAKQGKVYRVLAGTRGYSHVGTNRGTYGVIHRCSRAAYQCLMTAGRGRVGQCSAVWHHGVYSCIP